MLTSKEICAIFEILRDKTPNPKSELNFKNPYTFAVAVLLSAQATDKSVNKVSEKLFEIADSPEKMLRLELENLKNFIKTIGLFNNKATHILKLSQILIDRYNSTIPNNRTELENLPGIGRKSANVIMNEIFNGSFIAVDTHVLRVSNRLGLTDQTTPKKVEEDLSKKVPQKYHKHLSDWLVLHGRYICVAKKPKCETCPLRNICKF